MTSVDFGVTGGPNEVVRKIETIGDGDSIAADTGGNLKSITGGTGIELVDEGDNIRIDATGTTKGLVGGTGITITDLGTDDQIVLTRPFVDGVYTTVTETATTTAIDLNLDVAYGTYEPGILVPSSGVDAAAPPPSFNPSDQGYWTRQGWVVTIHLFQTMGYDDAVGGGRDFSYTINLPSTRADWITGNIMPSGSGVIQEDANGLPIGNWTVVPADIDNSNQLRIYCRLDADRTINGNRTVNIVGTIGYYNFNLIP